MPRKTKEQKQREAELSQQELDLEMSQDYKKNFMKVLEQTSKFNYEISVFCTKKKKLVKEK